MEAFCIVAMLELPDNSDQVMMAVDMFSSTNEPLPVEDKMEENDMMVQ